MRGFRGFRSSPAISVWVCGVQLATLAIALAGCATSSTTGGTPLTGTPTPTGASSASATPAGYPVKVYFSKHPETDTNVTAVFPVNRISPTLGVATFAMQQLILGPTPAEAAAGYFTELTASISGASSCGGPDFQYTIDASTHIGTLRFCRTVALAGDLTGGRIQAEVDATLKQFPNVTKVIILNSNGHCFNDLRGGDACLH